MNDFFTQKRVCVFGGTGTIGSLIVEYLLKEDIQTIRVFCNDENSLWEKQQKWKDNRIRYLLGDIRDLECVRRALYNIDYVINTAAIKHVPFAEDNPLEAVSVNIFGLNNIITASIEQNIKKLLHISTDKVVEPSNTMGCTKKISENLLQFYWSHNQRTQMVCVRLGNVYGSRGSIIPLIEKQKKNNLPITLTNKNMKRFFMYPNEVINFIIKAFKKGGEGEIWIPKIKEIKIIDLIKEKVGINYPIKIIGNRKGEKMNEKLLSLEEILDAEEHKTYWIIKQNLRNLIYD